MGGGRNCSHVPRNSPSSAQSASPGRFHSELEGLAGLEAEMGFTPLRYIQAAWVHESCRAR